MAKQAKPPIKLAGIVLIVVGAGLAIWGYQKSGGLSSQVSSALTGSPSDNVMLLYIGAGVCMALGIFLFVKK